MQRTSIQKNIDNKLNLLHCNIQIYTENFYINFEIKKSDTIIHNSVKKIQQCECFFLIFSQSCNIKDVIRQHHDNSINFKMTNRCDSNQTTIDNSKSQFKWFYKMISFESCIKNKNDQQQKNYELMDK